jgi:four helix bundle protein
VVSFAGCYWYGCYFSKNGGCGRSTNKDFVLFLHHAMGSLKEVECQVFLAKELGFLREDEFVDLNNCALALERKLAGYINYIRNLDKNIENKVG